MKQIKIRFLVIPLIFIALFSSITTVSVHAAEGGYSNYIPGFYGDFGLAVEPPTAFSVRNDTYYYSADGGTSVRSGLIELDVDLSLIYNYTSLLHKPGFEVFGAQYAYGGTLAFGKVDVEASLFIDNLQVNVQDDNCGMGDITLVPAMLFWNKNNFHFSLAQYIVAPTADYDKNALANFGLNYWTYETDIAATYLNEETGQDYSIVVGYNYNTENNDTDYQTGQEIHIDYMVNQFLSESWAVGIHGFYLKQVTGDSGSGAILGDFKSEAAGIGPAILWSPKRLNGKVNFIAKWLHEYHAENRLEGDHIFFSVAISF